jgi:hypothetical protein
MAVTLPSNPQLLSTRGQGNTQEADKDQGDTKLKLGAVDSVSATIEVHLELFGTHLIVL